MALSKDDLADFRRAQEAYNESKGRAIHIAMHHLENTLRIIDKLLAAQKSK